MTTPTPTPLQHLTHLLTSSLLLSPLLHPQFTDYTWNLTSTPSWPQLASQYRLELRTHHSEARRGIHVHSPNRTPTPLLDDLHSAASKLGVKFDDLAFLLTASGSHAPLERMLATYNYDELARCLLRLKRVLPKLVVEGEVRAEYEDVIERFGEEHFEWYGWDRSGREGEVWVVLLASAEARKREMLEAARAEATMVWMEGEVERAEQRVRSGLWLLEVGTAGWVGSVGVAVETARLHGQAARSVEEGGESVLMVRRRRAV
ncbi:hypothetical protein BJ508DRAFT_364992 [Ascobolus immersus RN42]|uniref:Uncharacterized protein n=1 Tax=Ascobolus immersus RN42 TaxID=1160509 RepID=A0A3N4I3Y8_ASCIM|nr:hypothetical protein BJ508DRAFT_364992 [Ascobolus immersus RN42]